MDYNGDISLLVGALADGSVGRKAEDEVAADTELRTGRTSKEVQKSLGRVYINDSIRSPRRKKTSWLSTNQKIEPPSAMGRTKAVEQLQIEDGTALYFELFQRSPHVGHTIACQAIVCPTCEKSPRTGERELNVY